MNTLADFSCFPREDGHWRQSTNEEKTVKRILTMRRYCKFIEAKQTNKTFENFQHICMT
jgi:hypothetical protein